MGMLRAIRDWLQEPMLRDVDIDGERRIEVHRRILQKKPMLKGVFDEIYRLVLRLDEQLLRGRGRRIEIGAGTSAFKALCPELVTTDVLPAPHLDMVLDAHAMALPDASVRAIYGIHCFHHFHDPAAFFRELLRVLEPGGGCVLVEPYHGPVAARFFEVVFDSETFDKGQREWTSDASVMEDANQALSWIVFVRDRARFCAEFPDLEIVAERWLSNYPRYLLSGGLNFRQLMPSFTIPLWRAFEWLIAPLGRWTALHHYIVLRKRERPA
ncbi:MAG: class I SAM-dependent methyltransferase [Planctomycetota bacterium]